MEIITSAQNPKIKNLLLLQEKSKARREQGLFVVEGRRELQHCLEAGFQVHTLFVCPEIAGQDGNEVMSGTDRASVIEIPEQLYRKVAYRESTEGILAEVEYKSLSLEDLVLPENPLVMVLESVEKPGNLGAVLRIIRASIGAVFTVPTVACSSEEAIAFLEARGIQILTAQLQDSSLYYNVDMTRGTALVMGTESTGLTDVWRKAASAHIRIPMLGRLDSLNVSVSAAILLFEAVRQRQG